MEIILLPPQFDSSHKHLLEPRLSASFHLRHQAQDSDHAIGATGLFLHEYFFGGGSSPKGDDVL